jgi:hypothetical protein
MAQRIVGFAVDRKSQPPSPSAALAAPQAGLMPAALRSIPPISFIDLDLDVDDDP